MQVAMFLEIYSKQRDRINLTGASPAFRSEWTLKVEQVQEQIRSDLGLPDSFAVEAIPPEAELSSMTVDRIRDLKTWFAQS